MAARITGNPDWQFFKNDGSVNASGTLTFYTAGTTTPKTIYTTTNTGGATHSNPLTLGSDGRASSPIFPDGIYDILVKDSAGNTLESISSWGDNNSAIATDLSNLIQNASFETDANSNNVADNWTETEHANISIARSTSAPAHGVAHQRFTVSGAGTASCLSSLFEVSNLTKLKGSMLLDTSAASFQVKVYINIYNASQSLLSSQAIYSSTTNPTTFEEKNFSDILIGTHQSTGRYAALKLEVADNSATGTVDFDGIELYRVPASGEASIVPTGLALSTDTDAAHDLNITAGSCKATDGLYDLVLETEITKRIDATWAAGNDAGGWESGTSIPTSGIIYVWLIASSTTGVVDVLFSVSATSPSMPSGYDKKRRILSWPTDASDNLLAAIHDGLDGVYLTERISDVVDASIVDDAEETAIFLCPANGLYNFVCATNTDSDATSIFVGTMQTAAASGAVYFFMGVEGASLDELAGFGYERVNANSQMRYVMSFAGGSAHSITFFAKGYRDLGRSVL